MSPIGAEADVEARTSKPPPKALTSLKAWTNDPVVVAPTTSVKTTSVNIASVTPVRQRLRSGHAGQTDERHEAQDHQRDAEAEHDRLFRTHAGNGEEDTEQDARDTRQPATLAPLGLGRLRQVADRRRDVHPAHSRRREGDDAKRE